MTWICLKHGPISNEEVYLLTWDSPHGDERHIDCGHGVDLEGYDPDLTRRWVCGSLLGAQVVVLAGVIVAALVATGVVR
jgi:hypothetical protein